MASLSGKTLLFIGCGNMGSALALGARSLELEALLFDIDTAKSSALAELSAGDAVDSLAEASPEADIIILAIKPQQLPDFLRVNAVHFRKDQTLISILAGVRLPVLAAALPCRLVRAMPNTPALVNEGMTALAGSDPEAIALAEELFACVGDVVRVEESDMDAVTAVSGSGPAYLFYFAETLINAAIQQGFDAATAKQLVNQTLFGAAKLLKESDESAEILRKRVTSPGGTTEAALSQFTAHKFEEIMLKGVAAAVERSKQLGRH